MDNTKDTRDAVIKAWSIASKELNFSISAPYSLVVGSVVCE